MKRGIALLTIALVLVVNSAVFAATTSTTTNSSSAITTTTLKMARGYGAQFMASIVAKLTGLTVDEVVNLRSQGQTFYQIALSKGVTAEKFKEAVYQEKAALVDQKVKDGIITKEQADAIKAHMKSRIDSCNGQGYANKPQAGFGIFGKGIGKGIGAGRRQGMRAFGMSR
ncbi:MAG: DUF2680 domain-containing protein [Thermovenabulum sp.]|uniref:DUF2680 domain-containing protein n=1 Tax=Thermovenabulum sp. TaxID=3100335 RepID=UPI003C7A6766